MSNDLKGPKKGAFVKLSKRLNELGKQKPPVDLMKILNQTEEHKPEKLKLIPSSKVKKSNLDFR